MKCLFRAAIFAIATLSTGCQTLSSGPPSKGLRYNDIYPLSRQTHFALDLGNRLGERVYAIADGDVVVAGGPEPRIIIRHDDKLVVHYYHVDRPLVSRGDRVSQGQEIARVGLVGRGDPGIANSVTPYPHLHLEVFRAGALIDPEELQMTCPTQSGIWWWPIGCGR